jgi:DNA-binding NtrC family response regulator
MEGNPAPAPDQPPPARTTKAASLRKAVEDLERRLITEALLGTRNNQQQAARMLGLSRQGLINKMKRYTIGGEWGAAQPTTSS